MNCNSNIRIKVVACVFEILQTLVVCNSLCAQGLGTTTGTLSGKVSDESGAPLRDVLVSVSGREGTKTATTDAGGKYIFPYLTPGLYNIRADLQGFTTFEQNDAWIGLSQRLDISFTMKTTVQENVTVAGESPLVDLTNTTVGANISDQLTQKIPIGRSLADIIYMAPGVVNGRVGG